MRNVLDKAEPEKKRIAEVHCIHYWMIEPPDGPTSTGVCKYCGAEKEFKNYVLYSKRDNDISTPYHGFGRQQTSACAERGGEKDEASMSRPR